MDERQIGLALALKEIGLSSDVSGFDTRLILQKAVYLLEESGVRLGYGFNWYLRGPYSPALTRDLFDLSSNTEDLVGWVLDERSRGTAANIGSLLASKPAEDVSAKARRMELLASIHFLSRRGQINLGKAEEVTVQLAKNGKRYSSTDVAEAIQELKQAGLL
ncbi:MAG: hypothetical protein K8T91_02775 [Planctomycetes bacterium]|nr:hypothetical protein [Planctomycetota bacterium]